MAHTMIKLLCAIAISLALSPSSLSRAQQGPGDFRSFCQKTSQTGVCIQAIDMFTANPNLKANVNGWLQILKIRTVEFGQTARTKYGDAIQANPGPDLKNRLNVCNKAFNAAIPILNNLDFLGLTHGNYGQYNQVLGFALSDVQGCEDNFKNPSPIPNPVDFLTRSTDAFIRLVTEGLNIFQCNKRTAC